MLIAETVRCIQWSQAISKYRRASTLGDLWYTADQVSRHEPGSKEGTPRDLACLALINIVLVCNPLVQHIMDVVCCCMRLHLKAQVQVSVPCDWCVSLRSKRQIDEDLNVMYFASHIRAVTESLDSALAVVQSQLVWLGRYLC